MKIKNQWSEVSLKQYMDICDIFAIDMDELDKQVKILSILSGVSEGTLYMMRLPFLKQAISHCQFVYTMPKDLPVSQSIKLKGNRFKINIYLNKITGGEYIDISALTKDASLITSNLPQIIAIFLKPVTIFGTEKKRCYDKGVQTLESRNATAELIKEHMMMDEVMRLSGFFFAELDSLVKGYAGLFGGTEQEDRKDIKQFNQEGFAEFWGWHLILDSLSNHDRTKWEYFFSMNVIEFLNCVSFYKDKQQMEYERNEAIRNGSGR